jgi:hypothetical protein
MAKRVILGVGEEFLRHEGLDPEPALWEDGLRADPAPGTFEWWYFDAHLDDGSTVVMVYATKSLLARDGPLAPMASLSITAPDGAKRGALQLCPPDQFVSARERCEVRVGPNWARGDLHEYTVHAEGEGLAADLVFTGMVPPWRPGVGKNYYDETLSTYFAWFPAIPYGTVTGSLTYDGQTRPVSGDGYHDHNWGNVGLQHVLSHWYWGRAHVGDFTTIFAEVVANHEYGDFKAPVLMLAQGNRFLSGLAGTLALTTGEMEHYPGGRGYPRSVDFEWREAGGTVHIAARRPRLIETYTMLETLPVWKRWLARLVANPRYSRFAADVELRVDLNGVRAVEQGSGIYELMLLR